MKRRGLILSLVILMVGLMIVACGQQSNSIPGLATPLPTVTPTTPALITFDITQTPGCLRGGFEYIDPKHCNKTTDNPGLDVIMTLRSNETFTIEIAGQGPFVSSDEGKIRFGAAPGTVVVMRKGLRTCIFTVMNIDDSTPQTTTTITC